MKLRLLFKLPIYLFLFFFLFPIFASAQDLESKIKAIFIYNFTRHINWPETTTNGSFVIGIVGDNAVATELEKIVGNAKMGNNRPIVVKKITASNAIGVLQSYQVLYFSDKETSAIKPLAQKSSKLPVLFIGDGVGVARKSSSISFFKDTASKIKFELNKYSLEEHNLKASSDLLRLATLVENQ